MAKKITVITLIFLTSITYAKTGICYVPKNCKIISSEFSTGGGKKMGYIMEVDCQKKDGTITKYLDYEFSLGGFFKVGRISMPRKIEFKKWDKDELECDY